MENFVILLSLVICGGALSASVIMLSYKWGIFPYYQVWKSRWYITRKLLPDTCDYCFAFWINILFLIVGMIFGLIPFGLIFFIYPFSAAAISQSILK